MEVAVGERILSVNIASRLAQLQGYCILLCSDGTVNCCFFRMLSSSETLERLVVTLH